MLTMLKALVAALTALLASLTTAIVEDGISTQEWITAAVAALVALTAVYAVPNKAPAEA